MIRKIRLLRPSLLRPHLMVQAGLSKTQNPPPLSHLSVSSLPKTSPLLPSSLPSRSSVPLRFSCRLFSSSSPSNVVLINSEEGFKAALNKVHDEKLHAVLYFTAAWCGPCRFISPMIEDMSKKFPHVTTYKIDIDQEGLGSTLNELKISAVPTLHFFQNGKKFSEVVGADVALIRDTMENLYKLD